MTHEELKAHRGTVWSGAGFIGLQEYEYLGQSGNHAIYGTFRRVCDDVINDGIQVISCYPTKRAALMAAIECEQQMVEHCLKKINEYLTELRRLNGGADKGI